MKLKRLVAAMMSGVGMLALCGPARGAETKFLPTRYSVLDAGTQGKPDLLLLPGLGSSRAVWTAEAAKLAPNFRLHLVQINGFAGQAAGVNASGEMLPEIVDELHAYIAANRMHPTVMGHSLGGLLTLMLAKKYPADVSRIVIVDALPFYSVLFSPGATVDAMKPQAASMRQQMLAAPAGQFAAMQQQVVPGLIKDPDGQKLVMADDVASDRAVFANAMYEDLLTDLRGDMATIRTPALMLYPFDASVPGYDAAVVDAVYAGAYKAMPQVKLVRIDGSRHFIMLDQPEKFDAAVEAFLR